MTSTFVHIDGFAYAQHINPDLSAFHYDMTKAAM